MGMTETWILIVVTAAAFGALGWVLSGSQANRIIAGKTTKRVIKNLEVQNEELRKGKPISPDELTEIGRMRKERDDMKTQIDIIAVWLRNNKKREIERGDHNGMSISDVAIKYMRVTCANIDSAPNPANPANTPTDPGRNIQ